MQKQLILFDKTQILELAARGRELLANMDTIGMEIGTDEEDDKDSERFRRMNVEFAAGMAALRASATAAAALGDADLMPDAVDWYFAVKHYDDEPETAREDLIDSIGELIPYVTVVDDAIRRLARDPDENLREALAKHLLPLTPEAIEVLEWLSMDPDRHVCMPAQKRLRRIYDIPWWRGLFARDPLSSRDEQQVATMKPQLERLHEILCSGWHEMQNLGSELMNLVSVLPDEVAVEFCERYLCSERQRYAAQEMGLDRHMLVRAGGLEAFWRAVERQIGTVTRTYYAQTWANHLIKQCDVAQRRRVSEWLLEQVSHKALAAEQRGSNSICAVMADVVRENWPDEVDAGPVLDVFLALPEVEFGEPGQYDAVKSRLSSLLGRATINLNRRRHDASVN